ncbi:MAG: TatD family hydrolase [Oscillospiraceae bacterium]|nr:TatD family hydrolase [Oscillospiraceae bacterium]
MYTGIFDTHTHYVHKAYNADRNELLGSLPAQGVDCVMLAGCHLRDSLLNIQLAEQYPHVWCAVGVHPKHLNDLAPDWIEQLRTMAMHEKVRAIGEFGLDRSFEGYDAEQQQEVMMQQFALAKELDLPVMLHFRDATGDALEALRQVRPKGVVHCFSGSAETARELTDLGLYLGIGGVLTYENARKIVEALPVIPDDKLLFETDCPYLSPAPDRRARNDSRNIAVVAERAAELRGTDAQTLIHIAAENGRRLFGIS